MTERWWSFGVMIKKSEYCQAAAFESLEVELLQSEESIDLMRRFSDGKPEAKAYIHTLFMLSDIAIPPT